MRILVVDDDRFLGEFLARALNENGHQATYLESAMQALAATSDGTFDLMLCDLVMPGINGLHAVRAIRRRQPNLHVIVLSSLSPEKWGPKVREAGASRYMQKPVTIDNVLREVAMVQASRATRTIGIIDADPEHCRRLVHDLEAHGCQVRTWATLAEILREPKVAGTLGLLLVDISSPDTITTLGWAKGYPIPAVAFGPLEEVDEDYMLRLGASLCLGKPVDAKGLLERTRFLGV